MAAVMVLAGTASAHAKPSNSAFLGVGMQDMGGSGVGPCVVTEVTKNSGAEAAGVRIGDLIEAIDGGVIPNCDGLLSAIQKKLPNDKIALKVNRDGRMKTLAPQLFPRDEVLRRRGLVGQPASGELVNIDDASEVDLSEQTTATIIGWFSPRCRNCERTFQEVTRWSRDQSGKSPRPVTVMAAMRQDESRTLKEALETASVTQRALGVPLFLADVDTFRTHAVTEDEVYFMVVDCRGVVQHLAPISADGEDIDAALDNLFAAADQVAHAP